MLDNLIAAKLAAPMIVAMPDGRAGEGPWKENRAEKLALFTRIFHGDVIPFVERNFRVRREAASRAMAP